MQVIMGCLRIGREHSTWEVDPKVDLDRSQQPRHDDMRCRDEWWKELSSFTNFSAKWTCWIKWDFGAVYGYLIDVGETEMESRPLCSRRSHARLHRSAQLLEVCILRATISSSSLLNAEKLCRLLLQARFDEAEFVDDPTVDHATLFRLI